MNTTQERGTTIRQPSTANLLIDSADRDITKFPSAAQFTIQKRNNILNGYFTRLGATEIVLEWGIPNFNQEQDNLTISYIYNAVPYNTTIRTNFYNVYALLNEMVRRMNLATGGNNFRVFIRSLGQVYLASQDPAWIWGQNNLRNFLSPSLIPGPVPGHPGWTGYYISKPDLRAYYYLDFVCKDLTYNQDLKDDATSEIPQTTLARWYMASDESNAVQYLDTYGFPILMGYTPFQLRRVYSPPKQIKWDPRQPLGNLTFEVYYENGEPIAPTLFNTFNWLMTLQVSEN